MFRVVGGNRLGGEVRVDGAKNAVLPILAASLMASGPVVIEDCPRLMDVTNMLSILKTMGCRVENLENAVRLDAEGAYRW